MSEEKEVLVAIKVPGSFDDKDVLAIKCLYGEYSDIQFRIIDAAKPVATFMGKRHNSELEFWGMLTVGAQIPEQGTKFYTSPQPDQSQEIAQCKGCANTAEIYDREIAELQEALKHASKRLDYWRDKAKEQSRAAAPQAVGDEHKALLQRLDARGYRLDHHGDVDFEDQDCADASILIRKLLTIPPEAKGLAVGVPEGFDEQGLQLAREIRRMYGEEDLSHWREEHEQFVLDAIAAYTIPPLIDEGSTSDKGEYVGGGFSCPICGREYPHEHTGAEIAEYMASGKKTVFMPQWSPCVICGQLLNQHCRDHVTGAINCPGRPQSSEPMGEKAHKLSAAPCDQCGYNGPGYYQPKTHKCAGNASDKPEQALGVDE